ncbi:MAG: hypothetical protein AcusKO_45780 [Acuticoccus sp.]
MVIGQLSASDPDGDPLVFSLAGSQDLDADDDGVPVIEISSDGIVSVLDADELDFETMPQITFQAQVEDNLALVDIADVTIDINDINEAPVFAGGTYTYDLSTQTSLVAILAASDPDGHDLTFEILDPIDGDTDTDLLFDVSSPSGELSVTDLDEISSDAPYSFPRLGERRAAENDRHGHGRGQQSAGGAGFFDDRAELRVVVRRYGRPACGERCGRGRPHLLAAGAARHGQ